MGTTIHFDLKARVRDVDKARGLVERMRQIALDLPFETVDEVVERADREGLLPFREFVRAPWCGDGWSITADVLPTRAFGFDVWPGEGAEGFTIGLATYPKEVEIEYDPEYDRKFFGPRGRWEPEYEGKFNWFKFRRWCERRGMQPWPKPEHREKRLVSTKLGGWRGGDFCKTQYAMEPECGGVRNFLRCHIGVVTLLERIGEIPGVAVDIRDEGEYGPYWGPGDTRQPGSHDIGRLVDITEDLGVGLAALVGVLKDAGGAGEMEAPILARRDFEALEFRGHRDERLQPFLEALSRAVKSEAH